MFKIEEEKAGNKMFVKQECEIYMKILDTSLRTASFRLRYF